MFDNYLHREMMNMAESRRGDMQINKEERKRMEELGKDDFARTMRGQSGEQLKHQIAQSSPELSQEEIMNASAWPGGWRTGATWRNLRHASVEGEPSPKRSRR